jgi:hypothetical protein
LQSAPTSVTRTFELVAAETDKKDDLLFDFKHLCFKGHDHFVPVQVRDYSDTSSSSVKDQVFRQIFL